MRISRDAWLALGLVSLLLVVTFVFGLQQSQSQTLPPYSSRSNAPDGALALLRWLRQLGYDVNNDVGLVFAPPADASLIMILQPNQEISSDDWAKLDEWVSDGGTLLLAGDNIPTALAVNHFHFTLGYLDRPADTLSIQVPLMVTPPIMTAAVVHAGAYFTTTRSDFVTHMAAGDRPVIVSFKQGGGHLLISSAPYPFSNDGLQEAPNPQLVLNLVTATSRTGSIWIDEWHHGARPIEDTTANTSQNWLLTTFGGRALLYVAIVVFVGLLLQGRSFGHAVPPMRSFARRTPLEYITAIANLNRRAGHRKALLTDYHHRLKRDLGRRYRLSPSLDDAEFVRQMSIYRPDLNTQDLYALLVRLQQTVSSENEMVELSARVAGWLDERPGGPV